MRLSSTLRHDTRLNPRCCGVTAVGLAAIRFREHHETSLEPPVALFLPKSVCEMNRRRVLTELGPDTDAQRVEDWEGVLFDLGLDA